MITFDRLDIAPDGEHLIIEASIDNSSYFDKVEVDSVIIDSQDTYVPNGPSSNPIYIYRVDEGDNDKVYSTPDKCLCNPVLDEEDQLYCLTDRECLTKQVKLCIKQSELGVSLNNTMLFVYVIARGYPSPDTPCGYDNSKVMGVVVNLYPYYQSMMNGIKEINDTCNIPKYFINNILRFKAIEFSIKTCNYIQAIKYWKKFFSSGRVRATHRHCECHGRNT